MKRERFENGQALVLIVLAIVAIFGFAALAVDIGRLYAERRRIQSAADAAALAAGFAASQTDEAHATAAAQAAAFNQLKLNDVFDTDPAANSGIRVDVEVHHPPVSGPYGLASGRPEDEVNEYYQVIIHSAVDQVFSQFVFQGPLNVTVEAVVHVTAAGAAFPGDALRAIGPECQGLRFSGNGKTHIFGGSASSDSPADSGGRCSGPGHGHASCASGVLEGNGNVVIDDGSMTTFGTWRDVGNGKLIVDGVVTEDDGVKQCQPARALPVVQTPYCGGESKEYTGGNATLDPGNYDEGIIVHGRNTILHLNPGLYCLNGDFLMNGGELHGDRVLIVMSGGSFQFGGNTSVNIAGLLGDLNDPVYPNLKDLTVWAGYFIIMPEDNDGEVHIGGGSGSRYAGTIYAPGPRTPSTQDKCVIEGSGTSIGLDASVICYSIKITGTADVEIHYRDDSNAQSPASLSLMQ
jgi:hypothetical protein